MTSLLYACRALGDINLKEATKKIKKLTLFQLLLGNRSFNH
jgi:hypothetical protein